MKRKHQEVVPHEVFVLCWEIEVIPWKLHSNDFQFTSYNVSKEWKSEHNERVSTMNEWVFYAFQQVNKKLFKRFPWYDVFISYILKFTLWSRLTDWNTLLIQSEAQTIVLHSINVSMCEMKFTLWWAYLWKDHKVSILSFCIWVVTVGYWHSSLIVNTKKGVKIPS